MAQYSSQPPTDPDALQALLNQANTEAPQPAPTSAPPEGLQAYLKQVNEQAGPTPMASIGTPATPPPGVRPDPKKLVPVTNTYRTPHAQGLMEQYNTQAQQSMLDQNLGLDKLQEYIQGISDKPQGINWTPLAAYIDSQNPHSKMTEAAKALAPMSAEDKDKMLFDLQNKLQGGRAQLSKEKVQALGEQMKTVYQQQHAADEKRHWDNMDEAAAGRTDMYGQRILTQKDAQGQRAADLIDKDTLTNTLLTRYNQIGIDRHTLETSDVVPVQMMSEMATGLAAALTGSKAVGIEATKTQQLSSLEGDIAKLQSYAGKPMNSLTDDQRAYLTTTFQRLETAYANAINERRASLATNRSFANNPHANEILAAKSKPIAPPPQTTNTAPVGETDDQLHARWLKAQNAQKGVN